MMTIFKKCLFLAFLIAGSQWKGYAQNSGDFNTIALNDLSAFREAGTNWTTGSDAWADLNQTGFLKAKQGTGIAVNMLNPKNNNTQLVTKEEFGDLELELDFMLAKGSNSGVYLQGRYEV